jgi:hypothetical protein
MGNGAICEFIITMGAMLGRRCSVFIIFFAACASAFAQERGEYATD